MSRTRSHALRQLAITFAVLTVALFVVAGATQNAHHGAGAVAADISWFGFLLSLLSLVVVALAWAAQTVRRRRQVTDH